MPVAEFPNLIPAMPELFMAITIMALLMLGVFSKADGPEETSALGSRVSWLAVLALLLTMVIVTTIAGGTAKTFGSLFIVDDFSVYSKVLVLTASTLAIIMSLDFMKLNQSLRFEFPILIIFATLGMMMMVSANDLMSLYLGLEMQSLSLYVIASFMRNDLRSTEAGLKYFVLGALASGLLLYGSSLVYGFAGTTSFDDIAALFAGDAHVSAGLIFGLVFVVAGLAFKISAVPFHMWTPDVYEGAPTPVTAFFAIAPKVAAISLFIRVMVGPFGDLVAEWQQIIVLISIASMVIGSLTAINQKNIKRMMAYSSIGHMGYAMIGLAVGNEAGVRGVLIYLAIYLVMNIGTFACILCMRRNERMVENIEDLSGLSKTHPMMALALAIFMFSMAGIPPLAGFFGKLYVFLAAIEAELYALAIIGVVTSVIGAFYYLRIIKIMYFQEPAEQLDQTSGKELGMIIAVTGVLIVLFFVFPTPVLDNAATAAASLFAG